MKNKLKSINRNYLRQKIKIKNFLFGDHNYKKFVIISRSRTGSTLLKALLNDHPNIICEGELFKVLNDKSCKTIWKTFYGKKPKKIQQVGFKLFYYHPFDEDKQVWDFIKNEKDVTIIHLVRENMLRAFVSQKIGEKTKKWTENINRPHKLELDNKKVSLDYDECLETFTKISSYESQVRKDFRDFNFVELSYEDLNKDKDNAIKPIFKALGVPYKKVKTVMKKQNSEHLYDLIQNYNELLNKFKDTEWEYLFK
ncbi:LPS sulfotransferase NodH [Mesoflavibacter sabulilitoris]|uniref:Sulfotransferase domain-containing protein n=1 Tax=Mesoflavibacter zeaxanthinifaciens subsp. sabulilitoris TaxID=1520893 RepID=A0A2T1NB37_9FLAO|nr:sulfotransferase [Mesoflavibacter zeaxanthinifaciens]MBB3123531.1 LPS sulfotransferase NodH [Mesoflavibacter zeaxanthinifaciens subsp. sabulilitoris]PSG89338.1 hypothetical protein C7H61_10320 [Mesoflavibacter zeaxanthinifaciens subsp. sabulilitoris]